MRNFFILFILSCVLISCSSSDVASNGLIQKRKYRTGIHLNLGNSKSNIAPTSVERKDSVIASTERPGYEISPQSLVNEKSLTSNYSTDKKWFDKPILGRNVSLFKDAKQAKRGSESIEKSKWPIKEKASKPIEPSDDPHQDGVVSIVLFISSLVLFLVIPGLNIIPALLGMFYGIKAKRGGEEQLGVIGFVGNLFVVILAALVLLLIVAYIAFLILLITL